MVYIFFFPILLSSLGDYVYSFFYTLHFFIVNLNFMWFAILIIGLLLLFIMMLVITVILIIVSGNLLSISETHKQTSHNDDVLNVIQTIEKIKEITVEDIQLIHFYLDRKISQKKFRYKIKRPE